MLSEYRPHLGAAEAAVHLYHFCHCSTTSKASGQQKSGAESGAVVGLRLTVKRNDLIEVDNKAAFIIQGP